LLICYKVNKVLISTMFYEQLLRAQIPIVQKRQSNQQCCLALLGPTSVKAAHKTLVKLTQGHLYSGSQPSNSSNFLFVYQRPSIGLKFTHFVASESFLVWNSDFEQNEKSLVDHQKSSEVNRLRNSALVYFKHYMYRTYILEYKPSI